MVNWIKVKCIFRNFCLFFDCKSCQFHLPNKQHGKYDRYANKKLWVLVSDCGNSCGDYFGGICNDELEDPEVKEKKRRKEIRDLVANIGKQLIFDQIIMDYIDYKNHKVTIMPIFFKASARILAFFSFVLFDDIFIILNGENLSLFFIIMFNISSVS